MIATYYLIIVQTLVWAKRHLRIVIWVDYIYYLVNIVVAPLRIFINNKNRYICTLYTQKRRNTRDTDPLERVYHTR